MLTTGLVLLARIGSSGSGIVYVMIPGVPHRRRDRDVDRALDDRRDAGREAGPAGARVGARQHLAPGRRRARPRASSSRSRRSARATSSAPATQVPQALTEGFRLALPDRRRPRRRGRAAHVRHRAPAGGRSCARRPCGCSAASSSSSRPSSPLDVAFANSHGRADRRLHARRHLPVRHRAGLRPADRQAPTRRPSPSKLAPGLHPHRQLLRPQLPADRRPERAADPRRQAAAGLVPAGADQRRRLQPEPADLRTASRRSPGGRASSRTPAPPRAARTSSSTSTTRRSPRCTARTAGS